MSYRYSPFALLADRWNVVTVVSTWNVISAWAQGTLVVLTWHVLRTVYCDPQGLC